MFDQKVCIFDYVPFCYCGHKNEFKSVFSPNKLRRQPLLRLPQFLQMARLKLTFITYKFQVQAFICTLPFNWCEPNYFVNKFWEWKFHGCIVFSHQTFPAKLSCLGIQTKLLHIINGKSLSLQRKNVCLDNFQSYHKHFDTVTLGNTVNILWLTDCEV